MQSGCHLGEFKEIIAVRRACVAPCVAPPETRQNVKNSATTSTLLMAFPQLYVISHAHTSTSSSLFS
jgi:hypothetical protein